MVNDRELMERRVAALYRYDARGRMLHSNDPSGQFVPNVFLAWTAAGNVVRFGRAVPDEIAERVQRMVEGKPPVTDLRTGPDWLDELRGVLRERLAIHREGGGPVYRFSAMQDVPDVVVQLTEANLELTRDTMPWLHRALADWEPAFAVVADGVAVAACYSSRIGVDALEAGVDTLEGYRGRGYAPAVTAAWGNSVLASGRAPIYSTGWDNLASQRVAAKLGLDLFGADIFLA